MTTAEYLASALVDRGLDAQERAPKVAMFDRVLRRFAADAGGEPDHAWWVPGRLEVFGKHTDYAGGRTLVCAVPRGFVVVARPRHDGELHVTDTKRDEAFVLHPSDNGAHGGWRHYVEVVARRFVRNFPGVALGADISLESDLARASGMSSSSALVVSIASALVRLADIDHHPQWRANIRSALDVASYFGCLENGMPFGTLAGDAGVGTHGGSEDHAAIVAAVPGTLSAFRFVPMRHLSDVPLAGAWRFVLTPCGVAARKTGTEMHKYNRLSEGTKVLLDLWNASQPRAHSLGPIAAPAENTALLRRLIANSRISGWPADALEHRLDHFLREDARVVDALEAFGAADTSRLGQLAAESQVDAETLLGNQIPETSALARSARDLGAFASCSFGAGFGGSVWALVEHDVAAGFARRWHSDAFVATPGPPLVRL
jgi:galactokinase